METVWILGDQLSLEHAALRDRDPASTRVLLVESATKITSKRWHRQRLHVVLASMRKFAETLRDEGYNVDLRRAPTLRGGLAAHRTAFVPTQVVATAPMSWDGRAMLEREGVEVLANDQFLCDPATFADWAADRKSLKMEDFYRWRRTETGVMMDGDEPAGGRWNFDHDNREPPPKDGRSWPEIAPFELDAIDRAVIDEMPSDCWGDEPRGLWPTTRAQALQRLDEFVADALPIFGPHEDAMLKGEWKLAHSVLSCSLNLGLLHPSEVVDAAEAAYREGRVPIASAEGFIRQVMGWREYVWGLYWLWMPEYRHVNGLEACRPLPPVFTGDAETEMACVRQTMDNLATNGWTHHIERLMILGNLFLTSGVRPQEAVDWMWASFVDGAEWVMLPNVLGMALYADGGRMATKPYASGGAYINRMSDHCKGCRFDPKKRTGETACPYTTLYWDFLARNEERLRGNHRLGNQLGGMRKLKDLAETRARATEVLSRLDAGAL
ncbi:MAG: cryptochrome/photolyase family protein [Actinomycetota bacterium]